MSIGKPDDRFIENPRVIFESRKNSIGAVKDHPRLFRQNAYKIAKEDEEDFFSTPDYVRRSVEEHISSQVASPASVPSTPLNIKAVRVHKFVKNEVEPSIIRKLPDGRFHKDQGNQAHGRKRITRKLRIQIEEAEEKGDVVLKEELIAKLQKLEISPPVPEQKIKNKYAHLVAAEYEKMEETPLTATPKSYEYANLKAKQQKLREKLMRGHLGAFAQQVGTAYRSDDEEHQIVLRGIIKDRERRSRITRTKRANVRTESKSDDFPATSFQIFQRVSAILQSYNIDIQKIVLDLGVHVLPALTFLFQLIDARTSISYVAAIVQFANTSREYFQEVINSLLTQFNNMWPAVSESLGEAFDLISTRVEMLISGGLLTTIKMLIMGVISTRLFSKDTYSIMKKIIGDVPKMSMIDFVPHIVNAISRMLHFVDAVKNGVPLSDYLFREDPIQAAINNVSMLCAQAPYLYTGLPVEGKMCLKLFISQCDTTLNFLKGIIQISPPSSIKHRNAYNALVKLTSVASGVKSQALGMTRAEPFAILLHGAPGIGKSRLLPLLAKIWSEVKGREFEDTQMFHRILSSDYWEGYDPFSHPFIHYSEVGSKTRMMAERLGDEHIAEITSLIDTLPFYVNMAGVESKGKICAIPEMVLIDTNNPDMNIPVLFNNPAAFFRRILFLKPTVKPQFRKDGCQALDAQKSLDAGGDIYDRWNFELYKKDAIDERNSKKITIMSGGEDCDIYKLRSTLKDIFVEHIQRTDAISEMLNKPVPEAESAYVVSVFERTLVRVKHTCKKVFDFVSAIFVYVILWCTLRIVGKYLNGYLSPVKTKWYDSRLLIRMFYYKIYPSLPFLPKNSPSYVLELSAATVLFLTCWHLYWTSYKSIKTQASSNFTIPTPSNVKVATLEEEVGAVETVKRIEVKDTPYWNTVEKQSFPRASYNRSIDIMRRIRKNTCPARVKFGTSCHDSIMLGVSQDYVIMNRHSFPKDGPWELQIPSNNVVGAPLMHRQTITLSNLVYVAQDIVLLRVSHRRFVDILDLLQVEKISSNVTYSGQLILPDGIPMSNSGVQVRRRNGDLRVSSNGDELILKDTLWYNWHIHQPGMSGAPLILNMGPSGPTVLSGIHSAGMDGESIAYAVEFTRSDFDRAIEAIKQTSVFVEVYSAPVIASLTDEPHRRSPFRFEYLPGIHFLGCKNSHASINQVSKVKMLPWVHQMEDILKCSVHDDLGPLLGAPIMKPTYIDGEYVSPYNRVLKKMSVPTKGLDCDKLEKVIALIVERIGVQDFKPLTMLAAINGIDGDPLTRRINPSTAGGYDYPGPKSVYLPKVDDFTREPVEKVKADVLKAVERYSTYSARGSVYTVNLKDEVREREKILKGKTRVFYGSSLDNLVLNRMFLYPFYTFMMEQPNLFCVAIGYDMLKKGEYLYHRLKDFSPYIMEGDYSDFDTSMPYEIGLAANTVVYRVCENAGYSQKALNIVAGILSDNLFPILDFNGDVIEKPALQPSGKYATAEDNSLRGLIMLMYAWYCENDEDFFESCLPVIYGDDVLVAVKTPKKFNNIIYANFCKENYGINYTPATKSADHVPFMSIDDVSFLKRNFRYSNLLKRHTAALARMSLVKMVCFLIPSKSVSENEQTLSSFVSLMYEIFMHVDSAEEYDTFRAKCMEILELHGVTDAIAANRTLPTSSELLKTFADESGNNCQSIVQCEASISKHTNKTEREQFMEEIRNEISEIVKRLEESPAFDTLNVRQLRKSANLSLYGDRRELYEQRLLLLTRMEDLKMTLAVLEDQKEDIPDFVYTESAEAQMINGSLSSSIVNENMSDMGGDGIANVVTTAEPLHSSAVSHGLSNDDFFSRPIEIRKGGFTMGAYSYFSFNPWDLYSLNPAVRAKLRNIAYLRGNLCVRFSVSGNPFHYGRLLVSYQPEEKSNDALQYLVSQYSLTPANMRAALTNYLSQSPECGVIDLKENRPLSMKLPFICPKPYLANFNQGDFVVSDVTSLSDYAILGTLHCITPTPVATTASSSTPPTYTVYAWMEDVELGPPTGSLLAVRTESGAVDEREVGPLEKFASNARKVAQSLTVIPQIKPFAMASHIAFGALEKVSAIYGWSKPTYIDAPHYMKQLAFQNGAQTIGYDTNFKLTLDPKQELTVDPRIVATSEDDMAITTIATRPSLFHTTTWTAVAEPMVSIFDTMVTPMTITYGDKGLGRFVSQPTACAFAVTPFNSWRGDVVYTLDIVCSSFHRGKIAIIYEPNLGQRTLVSANLDLNKQFVKVIDIQECQRFSFCIEWNAIRDWCKVTDPRSALSTYSGAGPTPNVFNVQGMANGRFYICPLTHLTSPNDSPVYINMWISCDNLRVNRLTGFNLPRERRTTFESKLSTEEDHALTRLMPKHVVCASLNESKADHSTVAMLHFGEQPTSFRGLLKRYTSVSSVSTAGSTADRLQVNVFGNTYFPIQVPFGATTVGNDMLPSLYSYLRYAYLGMRGSMKYRLRYAFPTEPRHGSTALITLLDETNASSSPLMTLEVVGGANAGAIGAIADGTVSLDYGITGGIEFEIPFYSRNLYAYSFSSTTDNKNVNATDDYYDKTWTRNFIVKVPMALQPSAKEIVAIVDIAAGEDFSFLRFQGAPPYTSVAP